MIRFRKCLNKVKLIGLIWNCFQRIPRPCRRSRYEVTDHLQSALALFVFKFSTLQSFDEELRGKGGVEDDDSRRAKANVKLLMRINDVPSDSGLRKFLDRIHPDLLRPAFQALFGQLQRYGVLKRFVWRRGHYLVSLDGTGAYSSRKCSCQFCCQIEHRDGQITNYHQTLGASIVHPEQKLVIPLAPEPIIKQLSPDQLEPPEPNSPAKPRVDSSSPAREPQPSEAPQSAESAPSARPTQATSSDQPEAQNGPQNEAENKAKNEVQNDCEINAIKRQIARLRQEHPRLKMVVLADSLHSNAPVIKCLKKHRMSFILVAQPGNHSFLFEQFFVADETGQTQTLRYRDQAGVTHQFIWKNDLPLNESHPELQVNFLFYQTIQPDGTVSNDSWVTDQTLTANNVQEIVQGAKKRWKIEDTFNTLKNRGYHYEHNFGHGKLYLATVFHFLIMLTFLLDQIELLACPLVKRAQAKRSTFLALWRAVQRKVLEHWLQGWEQLYQFIAYGQKTPPPETTAPT